MNNQIDYKIKYNKYKLKYINMKNQLAGKIPTIPVNISVLPMETLNANFYYETGPILVKSEQIKNKFLLKSDFTFEEINDANGQKFLEEIKLSNLPQLANKSITKLSSALQKEIKFYMFFFQTNGNIFFKLFNHIRDNLSIENKFVFDDFITSRDFPYNMKYDKDKDIVSYIKLSGSINLFSKYLFANKFCELISILYDPKYENFEYKDQINKQQNYDKSRKQIGKGTHTDFKNDILKMFGLLNNNSNEEQSKQSFINFCDMMNVYNFYTKIDMNKIKLTVKQENPENIDIKKFESVNDNFKIHYNLNVDPSINKNISDFNNYIKSEINSIIKFRQFIKIVDEAEFVPKFQEIFNIKPSLLILLSYIGLRFKEPKLSIGEISNSILPINITNIIFNLFGFDHNNQTDIDKYQFNYYDQIANEDINESNIDFVIWNFLNTKIKIDNNGSQSKYNNINFPDCVESGILQFIKVCAYNLTENKFDVNMLPNTMEQDLRNFIIKYLEKINPEEFDNNKEGIYDQDIREKFNNLIQNRQDFINDNSEIYKSYFGSIKYEIKPQFAKYIIKKLLGIEKLDEICKYNKNIINFEEYDNLITIMFLTDLFKFEITPNIHLNVISEGESTFLDINFLNFNYNMLLSFLSSNVVLLKHRYCYYYHDKNLDISTINYINDFLIKNIFYNNHLYKKIKHKVLTIKKILSDIYQKNHSDTNILSLYFNSKYYNEKYLPEIIVYIIHNYISYDSILIKITNKPSINYTILNSNKENILTLYLKEIFSRYAYNKIIKSYGFQTFKKKDIQNKINIQIKINIQNKINNKIIRIKKIIDELIEKGLDINNINNNSEIIISHCLSFFVSEINIFLLDSHIIDFYINIIDYLFEKGSITEYINPTNGNSILFSLINSIKEYNHLSFLYLINKLIQKKMINDYRHINNKKETPLIYYIKLAKKKNFNTSMEIMQVIDFLITESKDTNYINMQDDCGNTAIYYCINNSNFLNEILSKYKDQINKNIINKDGLNLLFYAIKFNNIDNIELLINNDFKLTELCNGENILMFILKYQKFKYVHVIIEKIKKLKNLELKKIFDQHDSLGNTILLLAIQYYNSLNKEIFNFIIDKDKLINQGKMINQQNNNKETPLYCAISNNHFSIVKELIQKGSAPQQKIIIPNHKYFNKSITLYAIQEGKDSIAKVLIDNESLKDFKSNNPIIKEINEFIKNNKDTFNHKFKETINALNKKNLILKE
jgi:hypothetical protein